ncbi:MAG: exo-alpha-sialidase, partial [Thermoplasmata archaeon]|nr:exo-alpha-sialidase [Thermoplasmata archaeon]
MVLRMPSSLNLLLSIVIPMVVISLLAAGAGAIEFEEEPTPISRETDKEQTSVDLAVGASDDLYAVWQDGYLSGLQQGDAILFTLSTSKDRGREFGTSTKMVTSLENADQWSPAIAVGPDGTIHVVWQERSRTDSTPGGPYWEVRYTYSMDGGGNWSIPIRVSQPNNSNNTRPDVAGIDNRSAFVVWTLDDHPGTSVALAKVAQGSRVWVREDFARADEDWELNGEIVIVTDSEDTLHAVWSSVNVDAMLVVLESQV